MQIYTQEERQDPESLKRLRWMLKSTEKNLGKWMHILISLFPLAPFSFSPKPWANGIKTLWEPVGLHVSQHMWRGKLWSRTFTKLVKNYKLKQLCYSEGAALILLPGFSSWSQSAQVERELKHALLKWSRRPLSIMVGPSTVDLKVFAKRQLLGPWSP